MLRTILTIALVLTLCTHLGADEIREEKRAVIQELLEVTGAAYMGEEMAFATMEQVAVALRQSSPNLPDRAMEIVEEESRTFLHEWFVESGRLQNIIVPVYDKYFTTDELRKLTECYKSDVGKKTIKVMPKLMNESMAAGQRLAEEGMPLFMERLMKRFKAEDIDLM